MYIIIMALHISETSFASDEMAKEVEKIRKDEKSYVMRSESEALDNVEKVKKKLTEVGTEHARVNNQVGRGHIDPPSQTEVLRKEQEKINLRSTSHRQVNPTWSKYACYRSLGAKKLLSCFNPERWYL